MSKQIYRVHKDFGQIFAVQIDLDDRDELTQIDQFISEGTPIILTEELGLLQDIGIDEHDIQVVERE